MVTEPHRRYALDDAQDRYTDFWRMPEGMNATIEGIKNRNVFQGLTLPSRLRNVDSEEVLTSTMTLT